MEHTSNDKISEALKLLEEAARQKKDELKSVMADKYSHLRNVIVESEGSLAKSLADAGRHAVDVATQAKDDGIEKARELAHDANKHVHRNPWPYIAGTAAAGLLVGFLLGRDRK